MMPANPSSLGKEFFKNADAVIESLLKEEPAPCPVVHRFAPGMYIREVHMPAGILAIGHSQNFDHLNVFIKGKVRILNPDGTTSDLTAPMTFVGKPGRKIGVVLEDLIWQNIYVTDLTDVDALEDLLLTKSPVCIAHSAETPRLEDRGAYQSMLSELGVTEDQVSQESNNDGDMIEMPAGWDKAVIRSSPIHGKGYFASFPLVKGETVGPARIGDKRTPMGRFVNHSDSPNCVFLKANDGVLYLVASENINGCMGGSKGEELTVDYRQALMATGRMEAICQQ